MGSKQTKTLAMRVLEGQGVAYEPYYFPTSVHDAHNVAEHIGMPAEQVYKTLVVLVDAHGFKPMLFMIASAYTLNLKKTAKAVGVKKVKMARHVDAERLTGLQVGGISALALLNQGFDIYLDEEAILYDEIVISAGQRGINIRVGVEDLINVTGADLFEVTGD